MKYSFVLFFIALACVAAVKSSPIQEQDDKDDIQISSRIKRATCDLLSVDTPIGSLNHAACAAHCLAMGRGFRGGYCEKGVCHCRK